MIEFVDTRMIIQEQCYAVDQMLKQTGTDGMKDIGYDNSCRKDAGHSPEDAF